MTKSDKSTVTDVSANGKHMAKWIAKPFYSTKKPKRVGRGTGSKKGTTAGAGHKGYLARSGLNDMLVFEGGQIPLVRKVPKFGFSNQPFKKDFQTVQVGRLQEKFNAGEEVNKNTLKEKRLIGSRHKLVKIVGGGNINKSLTIAKGIAVTKSVEKMLQTCGCTIIKEDKPIKE